MRVGHWPEVVTLSPMVTLGALVEVDGVFAEGV
jgi:hypothetical protein